MITFDQKKVYLGIFLILVALLMVFAIVALWPVQSADEATKWNAASSLFGWEITIDFETRIIILVLLVGGLGSYVHAATSFATFVGNRSLASSWLWWYLLRPFMGMAIALILYFVVRGGLVLLSVETNTSGLNPYGIAALAGLSGMFSKQATDKLRDIFDNLFKTERGKGDDQRSDKLGAMRPVEDVMLDKNHMTFYEMKPDESDSDVKIEELYKMLKGVVTRIPVINPGGIVKCVIHQSMLYKFLAEKMMKEPGQQLSISTLSLKDFIEFPEMQKLVRDSMAFAFREIR